MAQPTEEALLIINSIIYTDDFKDERFELNTTIYDWACDFRFDSIKDGKLPAEINRAEFENIINTIKNNEAEYSQMFIKNVDNRQYANKDGSDRIVNVAIEYDGSLIIAYKGTGGPIDWRDNGIAGYSNITDTVQQIDALNYYNEMMNKYGNTVEDVYVTGHSKGGNKAQYVGVKVGDQDKLKHVYSFDGQGFGQAFLLKYKEEINKNKGKITNICNEYDFVNILLFSVSGTTKFIKSSTSLGTDRDLIAMLTHKFLAVHSPYSMFIMKNINGKETLVLNETTKQSDLMIELKGLFQHYARYMNEDDWRFLCFNLMGVMMEGEKSMYGGDYSEMPPGFVERLVALTKGYTQKNKGITFVDAFKFLFPVFGLWKSAGIAGIYMTMDAEEYAVVTRDFSESVKNDILSIVKDIESEPWYDLTKWDVFYRIEDVIGQIDFPSNEKGLKSYYRKIIDMQGMSKKEIENIFRDVYDMDKRFSDKLTDLNDKITQLDSDLKTIIGKFNLA